MKKKYESDRAAVDNFIRGQQRKLREQFKKKNSSKARGDREADLQVLKLKINNLICNNRKTLASGEKGSRSWWQKVDLLTHRKDKTDLSLDKDFVQTLNLYFGNLCYDEHYIKPTTMEIDNTTSAPQLTLTQVFYTLTKIKKTATGPDGIPFWVWKDFAAILSPVVMNIWNTSLLTQRWPRSWKEVNVSPLPKVVTPLNAADFRGISVTSVIARTFERVVYSTFCKEDIEKYLGPDQFAYRLGGSCTNALVMMQHRLLAALDDSRNKAVRLFTMDFSKAFDNVRHHLLVEKLKNSPLSPHLVNWYLNFLSDRNQRVLCNGMVCEWREVNKGTTQGSVSGPYLFNIFLNDLHPTGLDNVSLTKFADDSSLLITVNEQTDNSELALSQFLNWTHLNDMKCNTSKCKEIIFRKKNNTTNYPTIYNIAQHEYLTLLGVTFQSNCVFAKHVQTKLNEANKCLYIIRELKKGEYSQDEIDHLFKAIVLPKIIYGLPVYGACQATLNTAQCFLERCFKRRYSPKLYNINELLEKCDRKLFNKISSDSSHPLYPMLPQAKAPPLD